MKVSIGQLKVRELRDVQDVVVNGLCSGCGLCESVSNGCIKMGLNGNGFMRPFEYVKVSEKTNQKILDVCPGVSVTGPDTSGSGQEMHAAWGPVRELNRSWSAEPEVRRYSAAGGTTTALARYLLSVGEVEAVLHVQASKTEPWLTDSLVSRTPEEILAGAQSRYGPSSPLVHVNRLLDEGVTFAVVAKPCDISAIRALSRVDPRVEKQIPYLLSFFCGGVPAEWVPKAIMRYHGVSTSEVEIFRYRGEGWPGPTRVQTKEGARFDLTYEETWYKRQPWKYDIQFRCKICPDAIGEAADVSAPDGWMVKDGKVVKDEAPGINFAISRTERGMNLIHHAAAAGFLELAPLEIGELDVVHPAHLPRKLGWPATHATMVLLRQPMLKIRNYRTWSTIRAAGIRLLVRQAKGTLRRVVRAGNREEPI